jgi:hypothetical protein
VIVKRRAQLAGLEGDFGAHSLRSGFVTEAGRQNIPLGDTMAMTGLGRFRRRCGTFRSARSAKPGLPGYWATIPQATEVPP